MKPLAAAESRGYHTVTATTLQRGGNIGLDDHVFAVSEQVRDSMSPRIRGDTPVNTLEFKLLDPSGAYPRRRSLKRPTAAVPTDVVPGAVVAG